MNGKVVFTEKTLDAKAAADAVGRVLSGAMDVQWCRANNQLSARGVWSRETDVLIHKPVALWKKMCSGYHPREGRDYEFVASGTLERPDVGCYGESAADDTEGEDESADDIDSNVPAGVDTDESAEDESVTVAVVTDSVAADSWRAEVVSEAVAEDALEVWAAAAAALCRLETAYRRALETVRRRWAIASGARPYQVAYDLAPDITVFEGQIYRVVEIQAWDDIPF